jgi:hypothetical protein
MPYYLGRFGSYVPTESVPSNKDGRKLHIIIILLFSKNSKNRKLTASGQTMHMDTTNLLTSQNLSIAQTNLCTIFKKLNVYLPSLMMKLPDHVYVLGDT